MKKMIAICTVFAIIISSSNVICVNAALQVSEENHLTETKMEEQYSEYIENVVNENEEDIITTEDGFKFNSSTGYIVGYVGNAADVVVPNKIENIPVIGIDDNAFYNCTTIENIQIQEGIIDIGNVNEENPWYKFTFANCTNLKTVILPESLETLGNYSFSGCTSLENINIPSKLENIEMYTFQDCNNLKQIDLTNSNIKKIGAYAFKNCSSLETVVLPTELEEYEVNAFPGCTNLTELVISEENAYYATVDGVLYNKEKTSLITYPAGKKRKF